MPTSWNDLLAFCITSAIGLLEEPPIYGPLRLIDCMARLIRLGQEEGRIQEPAMEALEKYIETNKLTCMYDTEEFRQHLQAIAFQLLDATEH